MRAPTVAGVRPHLCPKESRRDGSALPWPPRAARSDDGHMPLKRDVPVAVFAAVTLAVLAAWASWFAGGLTFGDAAGGSYLLTNSAMAVTFTAFGAFVLAYRPGQRIGLLFMAYGACYTVSVACLGVVSGPWTLSPGWERAIDLIGVTVWIPAPVRSS